MSLLDKISNGLAVMVIEALKSAMSSVYYYRDVLTFVCGGATCLALIALALMSNRKIGQLKRNGD